MRVMTSLQRYDVINDVSILRTGVLVKSAKTVFFYVLFDTITRAGMSGAPGLARSLFTFKNVLDSVSINNDFNMI